MSKVVEVLVAVIAAITASAALTAWSMGWHGAGNMPMGMPWGQHPEPPAPAAPAAQPIAGHPAPPMMGAWRWGQHCGCHEAMEEYGEWSKSMGGAPMTISVGGRVYRVVPVYVDNASGVLVSGFWLAKALRGSSGVEVVGEDGLAVVIVVDGKTYVAPWLLSHNE